MSILRKLNQFFFAKPTAKEIAVTDLEENRRLLIKEIAAMHYHQRMVDYYYAVIGELQEQIK
jgi:hypothetical protein